MLKIGELDNELDAHTFGDYLYVQGIENQVDPGLDGHWDVWVVMETEVEAGRKMLAEFKANPGDPRYLSEGAAAAALRREAEKRDAAAAPILLRDRWARVPTGLPGPLTLGMIVLSVVTYAMQTLGGPGGGLGGAIEQMLSIEPYILTEFEFSYLPTLAAAFGGEVWRLVTPIFLHFGILHIVFNMLWLRDLGNTIERINGWKWFALLVVVIAIPSNVAQFFWSGPMFGGMSGVVYGLLGYIWMKSKFDPFSGFILRQSTVTTSMVWFFLCLVGIIPHVANVVHGVGLLVGLAWGFVSAKLLPASRG